MRILLGFVLLMVQAVFPSAVAAGSMSPSTSAELLVNVVLFRADWCANCHILEPVLEQAMEQIGDTPVELVVLDFTNAQKWDQAIEVALDHNVVKVYNAYAGLTGLVVMTVASTGERIDCFNRTFSAPAMVHAMKQAVSRAQSAPAGQPLSASAFCPPGRTPL